MNWLRNGIDLWISKQQPLSHLERIWSETSFKQNTTENSAIDGVEMGMVSDRILFAEHLLPFPIFLLLHGTTKPVLTSERVLFGPVLVYQVWYQAFLELLNQLPCYQQCCQILRKIKHAMQCNLNCDVISFRNHHERVMQCMWNWVKSCDLRPIIPLEVWLYTHSPRIPMQKIHNICFGISWTFFMLTFIQTSFYNLLPKFIQIS